MSDICGPTLPALSTSVDRHGFSLKMLPGTFALGSPVSLPTLPRSGSMRNGICFERPTLAHRTDANGSSSWPTARGQDSYERRNRKTMERIAREGGDMTLPTFVMTMWPTATQGDGRGSGYRFLPGSTAHPGTSLTDAALGNWATPQSRDWKDGRAMGQTPTNSYLGRQAPRIVRDGLMSLSDGRGSPQRRLNPIFVTWLMGFPLDWLAERIS